MSQTEHTAIKVSVSKIVKNLLSKNPLFLDTETTGLGFNDEIIELCIIDSGGKITYETLVKPTVPITAAARAIHSIEEDTVALAPSFADILSTLESVISDCPLIIYNANFDLRLIEQSARAHGLFADFGKHSVCAMRLYAEFHGDWDEINQSYRWQKLETAAQQCGISHSLDFHRAKADCEITRQILIYMGNYGQ